MTIFHLGNNIATLMLPSFTVLVATNDPGRSVLDLPSRASSGSR